MSLTAALLLVGYGVLWGVPGLIDSIQQQALHRAPVHRDDSVIRTGVAKQYKASAVIVYRKVDGTLHRLLADESGVNNFVNQARILLDKENLRIKVNTADRIAALLVKAFDDREPSIAAYADWYFDWRRSWALLREASVGGAKGFAPNNVQGVVEASSNQVEAYLLRKYQRVVLKPEFRNHVIEAGIARILAEGHKEYLEVLTALDDRAQEFLNRHTTHLEPLDPLAKLDIALGWDQQKWKPRDAVGDDASLAIARGAVAGLVVVSVKPAIERAVLAIFAKAASRAVAVIRPQVIGAAAGTAVWPIVGTAVGWARGDRKWSRIGLSLEQGPGKT